MSQRYGFGWKKVRKILQKTEGKCFYCGVQLPPDTDVVDDYGVAYMSIRNWDIDHVIPISRGGTNNDDNLVPSCKKCNGKKSAKTAEEYLATRSL